MSRSQKNKGVALAADTDAIAIADLRYEVQLLQVKYEQLEKRFDMLETMLKYVDRKHDAEMEVFRRAHDRRTEQETDTETETESVSSGEEVKEFMRDVRLPQKTDRVSKMIRRAV